MNDEVVVVDGIEVLKEIGGGQLMHQVSCQIQKVVDGVRKTGKAGKVAIELRIIPAVKDEVPARVVVIEPKVKTTVPAIDAEPSVFYTTDASGLKATGLTQEEFAYNG